MTKLLALMLLATAAACSPAPAPQAEAPAPAEASAPAADLGPYTNSWDSAEFTRFRHSLNAATPGAHTVTLQGMTNSPGGETVALYPVGPDGMRQTERIMFVIADTDGQSVEQSVDIPAAGLAVEVVIENASGRRFAGSYTLAVAP